MKVLVFPRNTDNPYQSLLYGAMEPGEVELTYLATASRSQTVNLALLPFQLVHARARGANLLHVHWVYPFAPTWVGWVPGARRWSRAWYSLVLGTARLLGLPVVWTAHNLAPLGRVFDDDETARRALVRTASAVIAHSKAVLPALERLGAEQVHVIPFGPYGEAAPKLVGRAVARSLLGIAADERVVAYVGSMETRKGVEDLLEAAAALPPDTTLRLLLAGSARPALRRRLERRARRLGRRVILRFGYVADHELQLYFAAADAAALPYRSVTSSSSVLLCLGFGLPVVIPDRHELDDVPAGAALRYEPGRPNDLRRALAEVATAPATDLATMAAAARAYSASLSWTASARATMAVYRAVVGQSGAGHAGAGHAGAGHASAGPRRRAPAEAAAASVSGTVAVVAPHLDDAVLSCAQLLASHPGAHVVTVFAGGPRPMPCLTVWDGRSRRFHPGDDVIGERRWEDENASRVLHAFSDHLDFWDEQYRTARFSYLGPPDEALTEAVVAALAQLAESAQVDDWVVPLGLGHADHELVGRAGLELARRLPGATFHVYPELPYRSERPAEVVAAMARLRAAGFELGDAEVGLHRRQLGTKLRALACHRSQLAALGNVRLARSLLAAELLWRLDGPR